eukprot:3855850-Prymnesium_polylepis.1
MSASSAQYQQRMNALMRQVNHLATMRPTLTSTAAGAQRPTLSAIGGTQQLSGHKRERPAEEDERVP